MVIDMVYLVIDENEKIRKFTSIERMEKYMAKRNGTYFVIDALTYFLAVTIVKSENGQLTKMKTLRIDRYS